MWHNLCVYQGQDDQVLPLEHQMKREAIMFHVLDHADVVYTGDFSQSTQYVIEHFGKKLDEVVRSGIRILHTDMLHSLSHAKEAVLGNDTPDYWRPIDDWKVD
jgi:hypothetical protein